jgi:hypothetical protein
MIIHSADGIVVYRYVDPYHCRCFYVGGPEEYSAYERLLVQKRIADGSRDAAWDWAWGPWGGGMC